MRDLCWGCKKFDEIAYHESGTDRPFCAACTQTMPPTGDQLALLLLTAEWSPFAPKFKVGDIVEARTAATIFDGIGEVADVSMSLENGGTPVYPTFRVVLDKKAHDHAPDEAWYTEVCLQKVR